MENSRPVHCRIPVTPRAVRHIPAQKDKEQKPLEATQRRRVNDGRCVLRQVAAFLSARERPGGRRQNAGVRAEAPIIRIDFADLGRPYELELCVARGDLVSLCTVARANPPACSRVAIVEREELDARHPELLLSCAVGLVRVPCVP